jgi:peptidoglycan/xylan/chitin deacetylase (PgdA/CDA1 family)
MAKWPNQAQCAVMLTFDFDAETLWISRDPANAKRPGILSQGLYGAKVGVPKILEILASFDLKATFFVPGWTAEQHTDQVEAILKDGHEVGHHGYLHEWVSPENPEEERESFDRGLEALEKTVGVRPRGYRSPAGETSSNLFRLLKERDFIYDSSMMDDIMPYQIALENSGPGPVELPWHWSIDDAVYMLFSIARPRAIFSNEQILKVWQEEFRQTYHWGGLFNVVMHPQCTGRPSRITMLKELIVFLQSFPRVWFATGQEVAEAWLRENR